MSTLDEQWMRRARRLQTGEEWRSWEYLNPLVRVLDPGRAGERKPRLLTAGCVRRLLGGPFVGDHGWVAEALERQADAPPSPEEARAVAAALREVRLRCTEVMGGMYWQASIDYPEEPETDPWRIVWGTADAAIVAAGRRERVAAGLPDDRPEQEHRAAEEQVLCDLVGCVFRSPFWTGPFDLAWRTETAVVLAAGIYADRAFDRMLILADALEDAGCDQADILAHCRGPGPHVRGCWVVDLVLGKE